MKTLWYKNYEGKWVKSMLPATNKNLEFILISGLSIIGYVLVKTIFETPKSK